MAYAKSPASVSKSPATINNAPGTINGSPGDSVYTEVPSGAAPPVANAGADDSHNRMYGAAYQLAGSASGAEPITYEWSKVSGTPTVAFTDDTDPETPATFVGTGEIVLKLTATNAFGSDEDEVTLTITEAGYLDGMAAAPDALWCRSARLLSAHADALTRVRRASDSAAQDVPYLATSDLADAAGMATFCGANNGFEPTLYDQVAAFDVTQGTAANQPKINDSAGGPNLMAGNLAALYDATGDNSSRADTCGLSGAIGVTAWVVFTTGAGVGQIPSPFSIGTESAGQLFELYMNAVNTQVRVTISGAVRTFTCVDLTSGVNSFIFTLGAGAQVGTARCWQNGTELVEAGSINPTNTMTLGTTRTFLASGGRAGYSPLTGNIDAAGVWGSVLSDGDRAVVMAASVALYGV